MYYPVHANCCCIRWNGTPKYMFDNYIVLEDAGMLEGRWLKIIHVSQINQCVFEMLFM